MLHGGYKDFFEAYPELCDPISYRQMLDPMFATDYRHFRAKSKSWNGEQKSAGRSTNRLVKTKSRNLIYWERKVEIEREKKNKQQHQKPLIFIDYDEQWKEKFATDSSHKEPVNSK